MTIFIKVEKQCSAFYINGHSQDKGSKSVIKMSKKGKEPNQDVRPVELCTSSQNAWHVKPLYQINSTMSGKR